jgi:hypothetical protein
LEARTAAAGFRLKARLPVYPEYTGSDWIDPGLQRKLTASMDDEGFATISPLERTTP